jgi:hypothetical protein
MDRPIAVHGQPRRTRLAAARVMWVVLAVLSLGLFVYSVLYTLTSPQVRPDLAVSMDSLTVPYTIRDPQDLVAVLARLGFSPRTYAWYILAFKVVQVFGFGLVGWVIFWRKSGDWFQLLLSLMLVTFGIGNVIYVQPPWGVLAQFLYFLGMVLVILCFYLFPDGRFVPRWTAAASTGGALWRVLYLLPASYHPISCPPSPSHLLGLAVHSTGVLAQIHRYRHVSNPIQRQQTKWAVFGLTIASLGVYGYILYGYVSRFELIPWLMENQRYLYLYLVFWQPVKTLALLMVPLTIGISILRYRLWDIDLVIHRGLVYGSLTVLLAVLSAGSLFVISRVFQAWTGGQRYVIAMSASAVAFGALFQPARRRLQRFVDRQVFGIQIDYRQAARQPGGPTARLARPQLGEYVDLEFLGCGGMAEVYKARGPTLDRPVAIKVLFPHLVQEASFRRRFEREAQAAARLEHPNIVRTFGSGEADGRTYIAMEYISGPNLGDFLERHGRLPLVQARLIIREVASALDYAHQHGLIHRDVKPSNVLLDPTVSADSRDIVYRSVITDFGLARVLGESTRLSQSGVVGTFSYIAPEQIQSPADVDGRADVYALGVTAYQLLTGELPFKHNTPGALLIAHLTQPPPDPRHLVPDLPENVAQALQRALAKSPEERYPTAGEFANAITQDL